MTDPETVSVDPIRRAALDFPTRTQTSDPITERGNGPRLPLLWE